MTRWVVRSRQLFTWSVKDNVEDISFELKKGQTLGIIGATGSGKSTIVQLLMRFYDADAGTIRIHGRDIRSYDPKELRKEYGIVMQNDFIFQDSVRENIAFGRPIDDELLDEATDRSGLGRFIKSLTDEFDYKLNSAAPTFPADSASGYSYRGRLPTTRRF